MVRCSFSWTLVASALTMGGCADWLGLSELSFEETSPSEMISVGGASPVGMDPGSGGAGPTAEEPGDPFDDYAMEWPEGALAAFTGGRADAPLYWVYDPVERRLLTYRLRGGDDLVGARSWAPDREWTHLVHAPTPNGPLLIGYDAQTGVLERLTDFSPSGGFEVDRQAGNRHSHFFVGTWQGAAVLIGYQRETGFCRVVPAHPETTIPALQGNLQESGGLDCDQLIFARARAPLDGTADGWRRGVLCYTSESGQGAFLAFSADSGGLERQGQLTLSPGLLLASEGGGDAERVTAYAPETGALQSLALELTADGEIVVESEVSEFPERLGLTHLWPFTWNERELLVTFDGRTADLRDSDGEPPIIIR